MKWIAAASILVFGLGVQQRTDRGKAPEDPFLAAYYNEPTAVLCRNYQTANGARFATYQWWVLGFVSGVHQARSTMKLPMARVDVERILGSVSDHCQAAPTDSLAAAATAVVNRLASAPPR